MWGVGCGVWGVAETAAATRERPPLLLADSLIPPSHSHPIPSNPSYFDDEEERDKVVARLERLQEQKKLGKWVARYRRSSFGLALARFLILRGALNRHLHALGCMTRYDLSK